MYFIEKNWKNNFESITGLLAGAFVNFDCRELEKFPLSQAIFLSN
jgi:hypothetical protein